MYLTNRAALELLCRPLPASVLSVKEHAAMCYYKHVANVLQTYNKGARTTLKQNSSGACS